MYTLNKGMHPRMATHQKHNWALHIALYLRQLPESNTHSMLKASFMTIYTLLVQYLTSHVYLQQLKHASTTRRILITYKKETPIYFVELSHPDRTVWPATL